MLSMAGQAREESPVVIDVWTVDPARRDQLIDLISETINGIGAREPGFVSGEIYESIDGGTLVVIVEMHNAKARQRLMDGTAMVRAYREIRASAESHINLYSRVERVQPPRGRRTKLPRERKERS
jgi:quinol monooxygenase YgiN